MDQVEYIRRVRSIGRDITPAAVQATRELLSPLVALPDPAEVCIRRDIAYGSDARQRFDLFTPANAADPTRPLLVFVHGGGFVAGDKHSEGSPFYSNVGLWAVRNGCNGVTMTYRLAPQYQWPSGIEDLHLLLGCLREQGAALGLQPRHIFLMGQSAGASHVASCVAHPQLHGDPAAYGLGGLILLSGLYDWTTMDPGPLGRAYLGEDASLYAARSSLPGLLDCGLPLLVSLADFDPPMFEQQGLQLLAAWQRRHGKLPQFVYASGQNHLSVAMALGLEIDLVGPRLKAFIDDCCRQI